MSSAQCQHCGSTEIDTDPSRGDSVCTQCGSVLEDSGIVTEVQFAQDSRGVTHAVGQLVSSENGMPPGLNPGHRYGLGRESRAITLQNAKQSIQDLASKLQLQKKNVETAYGFYRLALTKQLTKGRKSTHVIAACVYMVCRQEETGHMLLDLSDILQISVYELGKTYLKLSTALCINIPALDPSIYIMRFANQLAFGKKTHDVRMTATRLVHRMKKDWMHTGRRPSGLCGAALFVASRLHNCNRPIEDIIKVVKVCQATVRKRLTEFSETPSSQLTLDEFMTIDLEEEQDPPAFKNIRKKLQQEFEDDGKMKEIKKEVTEIQKLIEKALEGTQKRSRYAKLAGLSDSSSGDTSSVQSPASSEVDLLIAENTLESLKTVMHKDIGSDSGISELTPVLMNESISVSDCASFDDSNDGYKCPEPTAENIEECMRVPEPITVVPDDRLDLTGLEDEELDNYLMNPAEYQKKDVFWHFCNADYLEELKIKEEKRAKEEENDANKPVKKKKRRPKRERIQNCSTAGEAIEKMLQQKKMSFKLNYDVLKNLNPLAEDVAPETATPKAEDDITGEYISPIMRRNPRNRNKPKIPATVPLNIKKGMSDIIGNTRKKEMLAAMAEQQNSIEEPPEKKFKVDMEEMDTKPAPMETIILDDETNPEAEDETIEEYEEEEYESDEEAQFTSSLLGFPKEERVSEYYECDEYVDDYDD